MNSTDKKHHIEMLSIAVALMGKEEKHTHIYFSKLIRKIPVANTVLFLGPECILDTSM